MKQEAKDEIKKGAQDIIDLVVARVVDALLKEPSKELSIEEDCMAMMRTREAGYNSVGRILKEMSVSPAVVDFAIKICLQKNKTDGPFFGGNALSAAGSYIACGASEEVKNEVILEMARRGWHGRIEGITRTHLGRDLTEEEARLLVKAYLADTASRSDDQEEHLLVIARRCLSKDEARNIQAQLQKFAEDFDSRLD